MTTISDEDVALKTKHRAMWASGNYAAIVDVVIPQLGRELVTACGIRRGDSVLDVAAGTGNAAIPAALTGATVVASDLTPQLFDAGRGAAQRQGVELDWQQADAESLPYADASFDVVMSCVGVMFAPHHRAAADELLRVCRPDGRIGLIAWTPSGFIGQMFAAMKPYVPPPPAGASAPPLWGDDKYVGELLGDQVRDFRAERRLLRVDAFDRPEAFRDFFKTNYGPTIAAYRNVADDPARTAGLDGDLAALGARFDQGGGVMDWEYSVITARRR